MSRNSKLTNEKLINKFEDLIEGTAEERAKENEDLQDIDGPDFKNKDKRIKAIKKEILFRMNKRNNIK